MTPLVVFDLDGTLIDSRQDLADSTNAVLESFGAIPLPADRVVLMVGDGARMLVLRALEASGLGPARLDEALDRFQDCYRTRLLVNTRPYDGIDGMLGRIADLATLAVLTNKPAAPARRLIEAFGWSARFVSIVGGDGDVPRKPDPAGLHGLMTAAGTDPASTMLVGDSMIDVETARRAGVTMCLARYGFGHARGDLSLRGDEHIAETGHDIEAVIRDWIRTES